MNVTGTLPLLLAAGESGGVCLPRGKEKRRGRRMLGAGARRRGRWSGVCLPSGRSVGRLAALGRRGAPPPSLVVVLGWAGGGRVQGWPDQPASASARAARAAGRCPGASRANRLLVLMAGPGAGGGEPVGSGECRGGWAGACGRAGRYAGGEGIEDEEASARRRDNTGRGGGVEGAGCAGKCCSPLVLGRGRDG